MAATDLNALETTLSTTAFLAGDAPSSLDRITFKDIGSLQCNPSHPNLWGWYLFVSQFSDEVKALWPEHKAANEAKAEDDDFGDDLFADDPNAEEEAKKIAESKGHKKEEPVGRSTIAFDIKPVSNTVDLDVLAKRVLEGIKIEGLTWGEQYKKAPVAFQIFKLVVGCTVFDYVDTESIIEQILEIQGDLQVEEEDDEGEGTGVFTTVEDKWVQSVDIANFQKL